LVRKTYQNVPMSRQNDISISRNNNFLSASNLEINDGRSHYAKNKLSTSDLNTFNDGPQ
jgi:hypothetical protein